MLLTEDQEQTRLVGWMTRNHILHYAVPNGGKRNLSEAIKFKRTGVKAGVPDLCIPIPKKCYHGLYIELKRAKGGRVSSEQQYWLNILISHGYKAEIAEGSVKAQMIICDYLEIPIPFLQCDPQALANYAY